MLVPNAGSTVPNDCQRSKWLWCEARSTEAQTLRIVLASSDMGDIGGMALMLSMRLLLQRLPSLTLDAVSGDRDLVLTVGSTHPGPNLPTSEWSSVWRCWVEALELLALTWHVDPHSWLQLVTEKGGTPIRGYKTRDDHPPGFTVYVPMTANSELIQAFLDAVFTPIVDDEAYSEEFRSTKAILLAQAHQRQRGLPEDAVQIQVGLVVAEERYNQREPIVRWYETVRHTPLRCSLSSVGYMSELTRNGIEGIRSQVDSGVAIGCASLKLPDDQARAFVTRHLLNQVLTDTLGELGAKRLDVGFMNCRPDAMEAFFSKFTDASEANAGVESLSLGVVRSIRASQWESRATLLWMLYGLFSQDARHSIGHASFPLHSYLLIGDHIRWLAEVIRTQGAPRIELLTDAYDHNYAAPTHDQWVVVPSGHPIVAKLNGNSPDHELVFEDRVTTFRVLRDDPALNFVDILVPGYGLCWIRRSENPTVETRPLTRWTFDQHAIRSMELKVFDVGNHEMGNVLEFLGLVGGPVESLCIKRLVPRIRGGAGRGHRTLDVERLASLLHCCPRLQTLRLVNLEVLESHLQQLYELHPCNIKTLELSEGREPTMALLRALTDPAARISRTLEGLRLDLSHTNLADQDGEDPVVPTVLDMLAANRVLRSVHLHISTSHFAQYGPQLRGVRELILPVRKAPLRLEAKWALLSVMEQRAMQLPQVVLTTVFEFAAECETRIVTVTTPSAHP